MMHRKRYIIFVFPFIFTNIHTMQHAARVGGMQLQAIRALQGARQCNLGPFLTRKDLGKPVSIVPHKSFLWQSSGLKTEPVKRLLSTIDDKKNTVNHEKSMKELKDIKARLENLIIEQTQDPQRLQHIDKLKPIIRERIDKQELQQRPSLLDETLESLDETLERLKPIIRERIDKQELQQRPSLLERLEPTRKKIDIAVNIGWMCLLAKICCDISQW